MNSQCERLSERMVEVVHRRASWDAGEASHLASCVACQAELRLVTAALTLGGETARPDPTTLGDRIVAEWQAPIARQSGRGTTPRLLAAAALVVLAAGWFAVSGRDGAEAAGPLPIADVELIAPAAVTGAVYDDAETLSEMTLQLGDGDMGNLDADELARLLRALEG